MSIGEEMKKTYIVSGIEPSKKGAGKFLSFFIQKFEESKTNIEVIYIHTPENIITNLLHGTAVFKFFKKLYYITYRKKIQLNRIVDSTVILFHPQSLGLQNSINLILNNRKIYIYVLDNFFFCKRSYNCLDNSNTACLLCLNDIRHSIDNKCLTFPNEYSDEEYFNFIQVLKNNLHKIIFLTQNNGQSDLLKLKFNQEINIKKIGMFTGEFSVEDNVENPLLFDYDILYHNTLSNAKGIKYFIDLCSLMPDFSFVIPYSKKEVEKCVGKIDCANIYYFPCNWENGLLQLVLKSKIIIVPSLWSAPIEGSLLKSLFYGNTVALLNQEYSFSIELPNDIYLRLTQNTYESAKILTSALNNNISLKVDAVKWIKKFVKENINSLSVFTNSLKNIS